MCVFARVCMREKEGAILYVGEGVVVLMLVGI